MRLDRWFRTHFPALPHSRLQKLLRTGQVRVDGKRAIAGQRLAAGQSVRVPPLGDTPERPQGGGPSRPHDPEERAYARGLVIYRDAEVIVIDKPAGLAVQGGVKTGRHLDLLLDHLKYDLDERPRLVHRLDRDTSGVLLIARTRQAARRLADAFRRKDTRKIYWAVTVGVPSPREGEINMPLAKQGAPGRERVAEDREDGKSAITWFRVLDNAGQRAALVALWPRTGRTHQLRVHLAALEAPILGDGKYAGKAAFLEGEAFPRQLHLHAREIEIPGTGVRVRAPLPAHLRSTIDLLGLDPELAPDDPFEEFRAPGRR